MSRLDENARGVFLISVTPFLDDGTLDLGGTGRLVEFYLSRGATGLTILGMMGEAPKLSAAESVAFTQEVVRRVEGRVPVIVGVSSPGFAAMRELAHEAMNAGAAGVMVAPTANVRTDDAIVGYFHTVAEMLGDIPFVLQDFPQANGVQIAPSVLLRIVRDLPSCMMIKHEDCPGLNKISALRAAEARRVSILTGNGGLFLPEEMRRGADGAMTGFAYPEMMDAVVRAHEAGDVERGADVFDAYLPLARYEQQPGAGLAVRKYVLAKRGAIASAAQRKPAAALTDADIADVEMMIRRQERRLAALG
jgi:4-hydroxy-tetrahydrodipicolinate synthase